jgi:hypothetical protein
LGTIDPPGNDAAMVAFGADVETSVSSPFRSSHRPARFTQGERNERSTEDRPVRSPYEVSNLARTTSYISDDDSQEGAAYRAQAIIDRLRWLILSHDDNGFPTRSQIRQFDCIDADPTLSDVQKTTLRELTRFIAGTGLSDSFGLRFIALDTNAVLVGD